MTNIDIDDGVYKKWVEYYKSNSKIKYPTLKNFTTRKIIGIMNENG